MWFSSEVHFRFRMWMDQVCDLFGGLDMCAISALRGRDNKDYIIEVIIFKSHLGAMDNYGS